MDSEFSEFANALLALRMGKSVGKPAAYPSISFSAVSLVRRYFEPFECLKTTFMFSSLLFY